MRASIRRPRRARREGRAATPDPVQAGKSAAATCGGCHGEGGVGKIPGMPSLAGLDPKYLVSAMRAYKSGQRKNDMMAGALAKATETEINNIALYYALQKPLRTENPAPGDQAAGKAPPARCAGCHGEQGVSENPAIPSLAGQDAQYFVVALKDYKDGSRRDEPMKGLVAQLEISPSRTCRRITRCSSPSRPRLASHSPRRVGAARAIGATARTATARTPHAGDRGNGPTICRRC